MSLSSIFLPKLESFLQRTLLTHVGSFVALLCLLLVGSHLWRSVDDYQSEIAQSDQAMVKQARWVAQHASESFKVVEVIMGAMQQSLHPVRPKAGAAHSAPLLYKNYWRELPQLQRLSFIGHDGYVELSNLPDAAPNVDFSNRDYFAFHRDNTTLDVRINKPLQARSSPDAAWVIPMTQRVNYADGSFAGVIFASLYLDFFQSFYQKFDSHNSDLILLAFPDGSTLARIPYKESLIGKPVTNSVLFRDFIAREPSGTAQARSNVEGLERRYAYRAVDRYPLVAVIGRGKDEILADWWRNNGHILLLLVIILSSLVLLGWRLMRKIRLHEQVRAKLSHAEAAHNKAQALAHAGSWEYALDTSRLIWSDENFRIHGYAPQTIVPDFQFFLDAIHSEDREEVLREFLLASQNKSRFYAQFRLRRPDGSERHVISEADPVLDDAGRVIGMEGVQVDITERLRLDVELHKNERFLRSIADNVPAAVFYIDEHYRFQFCNRGLELLLGKERHDIVGQDAASVFGSDIEAFMGVPARQALGGESQSFESSHDFGSGPQYHLQRMIPEMRLGKAQGFFGLMFDITEERLTDQRLQASEALLKNAESLAHIGSWEYQFDNAQLVWSDEIYRLLGLAPQSVAADVERLFERIPVAQRSQVRNKVVHAIAQRISYHLECRILRDDGLLRDIALWGDVVTDESGTINRMRGAAKDITERRSAEQAIQRSNQRELEIGYDIQLSLLMADVPTELNGAWITTHTEPSQGLHGDFVAVSQHSPTQFNVLVGDVMGKGVHAALIGAGVKNTYYQVLAELSSAGRPAASEIINALHRRMTPKLIEMHSFVTLALYMFDAATGTVTVVNAGHTVGLLARQSGAPIETLEGVNVPLGVSLDEVYEARVFSVTNDDVLVVFSDGLTESCSDGGDDFGVEGMMVWLAEIRAAGLPEAIGLQLLRKRIADFAGKQRRPDDQTVMAIRLRPVREAPRKTVAERRNPDFLTLPFLVGELGRFRSQLLQATLHLPPERRDAVLLSAFEAATNAIKHTPPQLADGVLSCRITTRPERLVVELFYLGQAFIPPAQHSPDFSGASEGGFGMFIMRSLVDKLDYSVPVPGVCSVRLETLFEQSLSLPLRP